MFRFRERLSRFMYGRYGFDKLGKALLVLYVIIAVANIFVFNYTAKKIIFAIQWLLLFVIIFRMLSRNYEARRRENRIYEKIFSRFSPFFELTVRRFKDIKYKRYRKCPACKAVMRLPIKRGRHTVKCVNCRQPFKVFIAV